MATENPAVWDFRDPEVDQSIEIIKYQPTWDELTAFAGIEAWREKGWDITPVGKKCFKLIAVYIREGARNYFARVSKENGDPFVNPSARVARTWPNAPAADGGEKFYPDYAEIARNKGHLEYGSHTGVGAFTKLVTGQETEFAEADWVWSGDSVCPGDGRFGLDIFWPLIHSDSNVEPQYSDALAGCCWWGGTNHLTIANGVWQVMTKTENGGSIPTGELYLVDMDENGNIIGHMAWQDGPPIAQSGRHLGLWQDGQVIKNLPWQTGQP